MVAYVTSHPLKTVQGTEGVTSGRKIDKVKINQCCLYIGMSQKVTDAKYIFAHLQQVRGVTVTKGMKRAGFKDAGRMNRLFKKIADLGNLRFVRRNNC